ncbi:hypothetical protein LWM68_45830 [Niabella sp. W65]|nr:hypothetical protein [Niabella sp. W65]MCH7369416.1 hypothetical protein [Niabella sp. W65]ULT44948.1 hypothetical protein KRR40_17530 [Niabella sp. I65]
MAGGAGVFSALPGSIQKAIAINPAKGSTFEDAEHIVLLMQENRSFDHCFGALKGVRGLMIREPSNWLMATRYGCKPIKRGNPTFLFAWICRTQR